MITLAGPVDAGEKVSISMMSGRAQLAEMQRQARLQAKTLTSEEREAIRRRREAQQSQHGRATSGGVERCQDGRSELQAILNRRRVALEASSRAQGDGDSATSGAYSSSDAQVQCETVPKESLASLADFEVFPESMAVPDATAAEGEAIGFAAGEGMLRDVTNSQQPASPRNFQKLGGVHQTTGNVKSRTDSAVRRDYGAVLTHIKQCARPLVARERRQLGESGRPTPHSRSASAAMSQPDQFASPVNAQLSQTGSDYVSPLLQGGEKELLYDLGSGIREHHGATEAELSAVQELRKEATFFIRCVAQLRGRLRDCCCMPRPPAHT